MLSGKGARIRRWVRPVISFPSFYPFHPYIPSMPPCLLIKVAHRTAQPNPSQSQANDPEGEDDEAEKDPTKLFGVLVHVRSFLKFLNSHVVSTTTIACMSLAIFHLKLFPPFSPCLLTSIGGVGRCKLTSVTLVGNSMFDVPESAI